MLFAGCNCDSDQTIAVSTNKRNIDQCIGVVCCGYWGPAQRNHWCALDTLHCTDRPACDSIAQSVVGRRGKMSPISELLVLLLATVCFYTTEIGSEGTTHESIYITILLHYLLCSLHQNYITINSCFVMAILTLGFFIGHLLQVLLLLLSILFAHFCTCCARLNLGPTAFF